MPRNPKMEDLTITNVKPTLKRELETIADNIGIPLSSMLKPKLKDIADSYPPEMKVKQKKA